MRPERNDGCKAGQESQHQYVGCSEKHTRIDGTGCYSGDNTAMIYSVVSRDEAKVLVKKVTEVDPQAFVNIIKTDFINGRFYYKTDY